MRFTRFRDWTLRRKMLALLLAASALPLAIMPFLEFRNASALIRESALALLRARADQLADNLDAFHTGLRRASDRLAVMPVLRKYCALPPAARAAHEEEIEGLFSTFLQTDRRLHHVALFDRQGTIIAATLPSIRGRNYAFRRYFQTTLGGQPTISDLFLSVSEAGSIPTIAYSSPVRGASDEIVGVALIVAKGQTFWDVVSEARGGAGPDSYSVVYDQHGIRVAHSYRGDELFHPGGPLDAATIEMFVADRRFGEQTRRLLESPIAMDEEFLRARSVVPLDDIRAYAPSNGLVNLGTGRRLKTVPWTLFYLVPERTLEAPVRRLLDRSVLANGAIFALALLAGLGLARWIVAPVRALISAADAIRSGDLSAEVPVRGRDELGQLGATFNTMVASLRAARDQLEEKVRARTEALRLANASLEEQNRALAERSADIAMRQAREQSYARTLAALGGPGRLRGVLDAGLREAAAFCRVALLGCYRIVDQRLVPIAGYNVAADDKSSLPIRGPAAEALKTGHPVVLDPVPPEVELRFDAVIAAGRPRSVALISLAVGDRPMGLLAAGSLEPFSPTALGFLSDLAVPLALTIARHELHDETGNYAEQLAKSNVELKLQTEELQSQRQDLEIKNREVQRADQLKSEFLANMSHELRTPLNAIIGFSELLAEEARETLSAEHLKFVQDVLASGKHLLALINDVLDLAKIEAGRMELELEPVDPREAVAEALSIVSADAQRKGIELRTGPATATPVLADRGKLRQVLLNLLSNAVKFSDERSSIEVGVEDQGEVVRFWVRDRGPGMPEPLLVRLFQPFVQGESALVKKHQGTGLGLAISRRLVEQHGGSMHVVSAPGKGSTFSFTLRTVAAAAPWAAGQVEPGPAAAALPHPIEMPPARSDGRPLVLLVEDDPATVRLVHAYLRDAAYDLAEASSCGEAAALARRLKPAAILLDLALGDEDGLQLLEQLKGDPATHDIPVVIASVRAEQQRGLLLGAADYLVKPIDRSKLLETVARATRARSPGTEDRPLILAIDDDPVVATVLRSVLAPAGFRLSMAATGREGLELAQRERPALAIVDLFLPDISGFEVVESLDGDQRTKGVPIIALTAASLSIADRQRLEKRVLSVAKKGDFTRDSVLAAMRRATDRVPAAKNGPTVLVVDDHDFNRELIRTMLERKGYRVLVAGSGDAGAEIARREQPSIILLDVAMPGKDGLATARELRADPQLGRTPLIAVTALAMRGDEERAREAGFDAYLRKPVDRNALETTIENLLKRDGGSGPRT